MDAGPDDVLRSAVEPDRTDDADLGPISPELVLVDPVLAELARQRLPDPVERPRARPPDAEKKAPSVTLSERPTVPASPEATARPRRWRRSAALAAVIFVAGAASGGLFGEKGPSGGVMLEARSPETATTGPTAPERQRRAWTAPTLAPPTVRTPRVSGKHRRLRTPSTRRAQRGRRHTTWATNVLGVAARVAAPGVTIAWQRPADSAGVVVLRKLGERGRRLVVFHGRANSYRDASPRPCTSYTYTIVNYDRQGHRSTGVPTSVLTGGCT